MKKRYSLTIANSEINVVTEESKETLDAIAGIVDRKIREIYLHSKGECSRTNAAILVCLDYCAERTEMQKTIKNLNAELEHLTRLNELAEREKAALEREIEALRAGLNASSSRSNARRMIENQIGLDEMNETNEPVSEPVSDFEALVTEKLTPPEEEPAQDKPTVKLKKKKVRAMFDTISFDDI